MGSIFESKNGRWMVTRGEGRWNVKDNQSHVKVPVRLTEGNGLVCEKEIPEYVMKHIRKDASLLEAIAKREEMGV